jgi:hypothetical protein
MRSASARSTLSARSVGGTDAAMLRDLASIMAQDGDYAHAQSLYSESLVFFRTLGKLRAIAWCLIELAGVVGERGRPESALTLCGLAEALYGERIATSLPLQRGTAYMRSLAKLRNSITTKTFQKAWARGAHLSVEQVLALVDDLL